MIGSNGGHRPFFDAYGASNAADVFPLSGMNRTPLVHRGNDANDPYATSGKPLLDRLGGNSEHARWNGEAERFCGHGAVRPIASRNPRRLLSTKLLQSSSGECRLNSASCVQGGSRKRGLEETHVEVRFQGNGRGERSQGESQGR